MKLLPLPDTLTSPMTLLIYPLSFLMHVEWSADAMMPRVLPSVTWTPSMNFYAFPPLLSNVIVFKSSQNFGTPLLICGIFYIYGILCIAIKFYRFIPSFSYCNCIKPLLYPYNLVTLKSWSKRLIIFGSNIFAFCRLTDVPLIIINYIYPNQSFIY